jgi:hypothetical protein
MHGIIAMAGLAEAAEFYSLVIFSGVLVLVAGLLTLAWWKCWPIAALLGCLVCYFVSLFIQPWHVLAPAISDDPDQSYWLFRWRMFAVVWAALSITGLVSFYILTRRSGSKYTHHFVTLKWFKQWGWLYAPASVPGAIIALVMLMFCGQAFIAIDHHSHSTSDTLYRVFPFFACAFLLFDWIGARTSN